MKNKSNNQILKTGMIFVFYLVSTDVLALKDRSIRENIRQEQRINELEKHLNTEENAFKSQIKLGKISIDNLIVPEKPCFKINQIKFIVNDPLQKKDQSEFNFLFYSLNQENLIIGQCIGTQSLQNIVRYAQNELIKKGYVTSQFIVNKQDLSSGELVFNIGLGRVSQIYSKDNSISKSEIYSAFPNMDGEIFNLKNIDQGLENLKKISNRDVDIKIEPAISNNGEELIGYSNLAVSSRSYKKVRLNIGVDDSGYKSTGRYIGNIGATLNNPFHINDMMNINASHSLDDWNKDLNQSFYISYLFPFKNYDLSASFNEYIFEQNTPSFSGKPITYIGNTQQSNVTLGRLLSRSTNYKTSIYIKGYHKTTRNSFAGIDLVSQNRTTTGWNLGLQYRHYLGTGVLDLGINYRRGTGALNATSAPEENIYFGSIHLPVEGYARAPLWSGDIVYTQPFTIANSTMQYKLNWHGQYAEKYLVGPDRFSIGGRYNVRGFDGDFSLAGDHGHYLQQEMSWNSPVPFTQLYAGVDQGWVSGRTNIKNQNYLIGSVFGTRSYYKGVYLETFLGHGLNAPKIIKKGWVAGFNINFSY